MKVTKFMKGLLAAALAVTMAVTPAASVKAAEVTVTSGASTYTFSEMPVAAFEVTGLFDDPIILFFLSEDTHVSSQVGSSFWQADKIANVDFPNMGVGTKYYRWDYNLESDWGSDASEDNQDDTNLPDGAYRGSGWFYTDEVDFVADDGYVIYKTDFAGDDLPAVVMREIYHEDVSGLDTIYVTIIKETDEIALAKEAFAYTGMTAVQIPVEDALTRGSSASVQSDTTQQAAEAQAAQQAAEAAAQTEAQTATQTQITSQQTSVSQGTYIVEAGDNLCKIAQKVYGDMKAWREIYKANAGVVKSDYVIYKGQVLVIPAR